MNVICSYEPVTNKPLSVVKFGKICTALVVVTDSVESPRLTLIQEAQGTWLLFKKEGTI